MKGYKHLTFTQRIQIEALLKAGLKPKAIAREIGVSDVTVYRELKRGRYLRLNSDYTTSECYSPDIAQQKYDVNIHAKGADLKIGKDHKLAQFIEYKIAHDHYSPEAVLGEIKALGLQFDTTLCKSTIYSYISKGVFLTITNKDLPYKKVKKRKNRKVRPARPPRGKSIENRPPSILERKEIGHWEMDCVIGKKETRDVLLVLTERLSRFEIISRMPDKSTASVVREIDRLEHRLGAVFTDLFRTITVDNGTEFSDCAGIEQSVRGDGKRTTVYYCHPYSSSERGSNENANRIIRRFIPKGANIGEYDPEYIQSVADWMNNYPRRIHGYKSARAVFKEHFPELIS